MALQLSPQRIIAVIRFKKGDTIIEVTLAITIFSMVAIAGVTLMNLGVGTAQASLQLMMAREAIDAQAEALRTIHHAYVATGSAKPSPNSIADRWNTIITSNTAGTVSKFGGTGCSSIIPSTNRFVIDVRNLDSTSTNPVKTKAADIGQAATFPRLIYNGAVDSNKVDEALSASFTKAEGLWIQAVKSVKDKSGRYLAYDFHIRACWNAPGKSVPTTIGTIIRLYSPSDTSSAISGDEPAECVNL